MRPGTILRWRALKNILKSELSDSSYILDIGGYDGYVSSKLKKILPYIRVDVVDIDTIGLRLAQNRGLGTVHASALQLPIEDNRADAVLCLDLIEHVEEDERVIKEISRVLKKGGKVILTTPTENGISFPFLSKEKIEDVNVGWGHLRRGYSQKSLERLFRDGGLSVTKQDNYFNFFTRLIYRFIFLSGLPSRYIALLYRCIIALEPFIKYKAQSHIIVGQKAAE